MNPLNFQRLTGLISVLIFIVILAWFLLDSAIEESASDVNQHSLSKDNNLQDNSELIADDFYPVPEPDGSRTTPSAELASKPEKSLDAEQATKSEQSLAIADKSQELKIITSNAGETQHSAPIQTKALSPPNSTSKLEANSVLVKSPVDTQSTDSKTSSIKQNPASSDDPSSSTETGKVESSEKGLTAETTQMAAVASAAIPRDWYLQIASFSVKLNAENLHNLLSAKGYQSKIVVWQASNDKKLYRVRVGPIPEKTKASTIKTEIDKQFKLSSQLIQVAPLDK